MTFRPTGGAMLLPQTIILYGYEGSAYEPDGQPDCGGPLNAPSGAAAAGRIRKLCETRGYRCIAAAPEDEERPVIQLIMERGAALETGFSPAPDQKVPNLGGTNQKEPAMKAPNRKAMQESADQHRRIAEPMIVLAGFDRSRLEEVLEALKAAGAGKEVLKAVLTPTNAAWSGRALYEELTRERRSLS